uniref:Uncharacterized protein n=1 Tax=Meloidogyne enterolobii TaxID=390850 RepID=A0A6V7VJG0_MELEN|nr:unnamed protein product [Meloidogyne enterolobii]
MSFGLNVVWTKCHLDQLSINVFRHYVQKGGYLNSTNCTNMENCNNLTKFKKYCLDRLDYIYAAWNALSSYSEKLEVQNKRLKEQMKILEEENKVLKEENNILKEEKNLAYKKLEEMTQVLNTFINQNVKQRNIFEEIESPENISANTSTSIEPELQNNYNNVAGPSNHIELTTLQPLNFKQLQVLFPVSSLPPRIEERTIWDEVDEEEEENLEKNLEEENEDDCW